MSINRLCVNCSRLAEKDENVNQLTAELAEMSTILDFSVFKHKAKDKKIEELEKQLHNVGCHYCNGLLDAKEGVGQYECPRCIKEFGKEIK